MDDLLLEAAHRLSYLFWMALLLAGFVATHYNAQTTDVRDRRTTFVFILIVALGAILSLWVAGIHRGMEEVSHPTVDVGE